MSKREAKQQVIDEPTEADLKNKPKKCVHCQGLDFEWRDSNWWCRYCRHKHLDEFVTWPNLWNQADPRNQLNKRGDVMDDNKAGQSEAPPGEKPKVCPSCKNKEFKFRDRSWWCSWCGRRTVIEFLYRR